MLEHGAGRREWVLAPGWLGTEATGVWVSGSSLLLTLATRLTGTLLFLSPGPGVWEVENRAGNEPSQSMKFHNNGEGSN